MSRAWIEQRPNWTIRYATGKQEQCLCLSKEVEWRADVPYQIVAPSCVMRAGNRRYSSQHRVAKYRDNVVVFAGSKHCSGEEPGLGEVRYCRYRSLRDGHGTAKPWLVLAWVGH